MNGNGNLIPVPETQLFTLWQLEVGNDALLMWLFINNTKIANCDGYAKIGAG